MSEFLEKTLIGGFSCVNTKLAFDTLILLNENKNEKVLYDLEIDGKKTNKKNFKKNIKNGGKQSVWAGIWLHYI